MADKVVQTREQLRKSQSKYETLQIYGNRQLQSKLQPSDDQLESNTWKH